MLYHFRKLQVIEVHLPDTESHEINFIFEL